MSPLFRRAVLGIGWQRDSIIFEEVFGRRSGLNDGVCDVEFGDIRPAVAVS
jgi:hypothetical protein